MNIRLARKDELFEIFTTFKAFEQCTEFVLVIPEIPAANYAGFIERGVGGVILGEIDGELAGGLGYLIGNDLHCGKKYAVETFWLMLPAYRGKGLLLLDEFERIARAAACDGCAMVHLADSFPSSLERIYGRKKYHLVEKHYVKELRP